MAPDAVERTALEENGSPDARSVVQRVGFQFQYERSFHVITPHFGTVVILTLVILTQRALLFYWQNIQVFGPVSVQNSKNCFRKAEAVSSVFLLFDFFHFGFDVYVRAAEADLADVRAVGDGRLEVQFASELTDDTGYAEQYLK